MKRREPNRDVRDLGEILGRLAQALITLSDAFVAEGEIWSDEEQLYMESPLSGMPQDCLDVCIQNGRIFMTISRDLG